MVSKRSGRRETYPFRITILANLPRSIQIRSIQAYDCDCKDELEEAEEDVGEVGFGLGGEGDHDVCFCFEEDL